METQTGNRRLPNPRALRWWYLFVFVGAALIVAAFQLDQAARLWVTEHRTPEILRIMQFISRAGDWPAHVALGLFLFGIAWWRGKRDWMRIFLAMLIACAIAGAVARVVKIGTGRARPSVQTEQTWSGPRLAEKYHAFPSGHTAASAAFFGVLAFRRPRVGLPLLLIPALIAASRMYVAAHYLSDVVCACLLGLICAWFVARAIELRQSKN
ncbi:MAG: phosphatase PAP2 family protein [Chthoniobacterales bacterium]